MKNHLFSLIDSVIYLVLLVVVAVTPLLFLSLTTEFYNMPKLIFLVAATLILYGLWTLSWVVRGKVVITKTPLDIPLFVLLVAILLSTFLSTSKYASIFGIFPEVHGSTISWVTYILLYFVAASNIRVEKRVKTFLQVALGSVTLLSLVSILSFFKVFLPFAIARGVNFSPAGSTFSAEALMLLFLPLTLISSVIRNKFIPKPLAVLISIFLTTAVILIGSIPSYVLILLIFIAATVVVQNHLNVKTLPLLFAPFVLAILILTAMYLPFSGNALYKSRVNFPQEIQLPVNISWKISASAFRDAPFLGTGPATYLYDFTQYKPIEFNQLDFWNFTFNTANNELIQVLGTWGLFGLFSLAAVFVVIFIQSKKYILINKLSDQDGIPFFLPGLAVSGLVAVMLLFIHASTLVSVVFTLLLAACLMVSQKHVREKVSELSFGINISTSSSRQMDLLPVVVFILFLVAAFFTGRETYRVVAADYYHRLALTQASKNGTKTYEYLQKAENLNPLIDLYRIDMAQTNFALANALATQKGPTTDNPKGTLNDTDKQTIQTLISQAINEGRASVVLAPRSSRNWQVLGMIYRNITGVAKNSLTFALDAYGRAIQMDPYNPALRVSVGSIYYTTKNYDLAVRFYTDAINLKPDYINGYYNLALALRDKGDLQNAQQVAEQAVGLLQKSINSGSNTTTSQALRATQVQDYKTITQFLDDLKAKQANSNSESNTQTGTALQNPNLPNINVPSLNNPPETTTPPEVNQNPDATLPQLTPTVSVTPTPTP